MASITDGQPVDAANSNAAWVSLTSNAVKVGLLSLADGSSATITAVQKLLN